ncbi:MAG: hypothetical protein NVV83_10280 [Afipia sp.]|nr:hypothetical protein [Afipia sp.]
MTILSWIKRHSLSRHAGDKAADGPTAIARKNELSAFDAARASNIIGGEIVK